MAPASSAGYSGTSLPQKLGIKEGKKLAILREPDRFRETLGHVPDGVSITTRVRAGSDADVIVAALGIRRATAQVDGSHDVDGGLWISWPKRSSRVTTDITEDTLRGPRARPKLVERRNSRDDRGNSFTR